ncbi:hypothetical protein ACFS07_31470 [Undibacterium arcticum]
MRHDQRGGAIIMRLPTARMIMPPLNIWSRQIIPTSSVESNGTQSWILAAFFLHQNKTGDKTTGFRGTDQGVICQRFKFLLQVRASVFANLVDQLFLPG